MDGASGSGPIDGPGELHPVPGGLPESAEAAFAAAGVGRGCGPVSLLLVGIVLLMLGGGIRWAQDVTAPWLNEGEADLPDTVTFEADDATYRVITSGPTRPAIHQTACTVERADGKVLREEGRDGVDGGQERFGVTRVLEFRAVAGTTTVQCGFDFAPERGSGRFQVVRADGPITIATIVLLVLGVAALVVSIGWFVAVVLQSGDDPPGGAVGQGSAPNAS
ncbi:MAG: hypothetical protein R2702_04090 [Acidimicrobiales bacterium]